jgi:hypothetical protein
MERDWKNTMKKQINKTNWWIDLILFSGFVLAFLLDLTGLTIHQWGGLFICVLAFYHLLRHWKWVLNILQRFFARGAGSQRVRFLVDLFLFFGFELILLTGLMISSWFNLPLTDYELVRTVHVIASVSSLVLLVGKMALHMRWILSTMRKIFQRFVAQQFPVETSSPFTPAFKPIERREMLRMMGIVGSVSLAAILFGGASTFRSMVSGDSTTENNTAQRSDPQVHTTTQESTQAASTPPASPTSTLSAEPLPTLTPTSTPIASTCIVRCPNSCSFPGRCRRYVDANANNRCDLGECL